jgi:uncharacterized glyoxalase superfamily protein PhnB
MVDDSSNSIAPYLFYKDGIAALEWLSNAFGFRERMRQVGQDGALQHGEMQHGNATIMLGCPPDYRNPKELGQVTVGLYVRVDDVDAHYARSVAAGAEIEGAPVDKPYGDRLYGVRDLEGHQWWFASPVR